MRYSARRIIIILFYSIFVSSSAFFLASLSTLIIFVCETEPATNMSVQSTYFRRLTSALKFMTVSSQSAPDCSQSYCPWPSKFCMRFYYRLQDSLEYFAPARTWLYHFYLAMASYQRTGRFFYAALVCVGEFDYLAVTGLEFSLPATCWVQKSDPFN